MVEDLNVLDRAEVAGLKNVDIDVEAKQGNGKIEWALVSKTIGHGTGDKIKLDPGEGYTITFDLVNQERLDVRFDASSPIFVREGSGTFCPTKLDSKQIMIDSCSAKQLVVIDWNFGNKRDLHYQLNFVTETGQPVDPCDPIIQNGGGGDPPFIDI